MSALTKEDKLSILNQLVKRVKNWRFQKSLPMIIWMGKPSFSRSSLNFGSGLKMLTKELPSYLEITHIGWRNSMTLNTTK
jgi:hypothetical protein